MRSIQPGGLILLLSLALAGQAQTQADAEIEYLLNFVAASDCIFIRNDDRHEPADAADHLRLKYSRGKRYIDSADQFIDRLASESSWTGKPYTVDCNGRTELTRDWLHRALAEYRHQPPGAAP